MPLLVVQNLSKAYGSHRVVDMPTFTLEAGAQVALRGESGSGKTTFQ
ncbi:MAG: putative transport system ATP-binding protein, partial [Verrucomicrobiota bacterium]|nr:putative transport system ATP-binding protein [Verrucomicrobiota bacterium]